MVLAAVLGWSLRERAQRPPIEPSLTQFTWSLPEGMGLDSAPVASPDGRRIAFTAISGGSPSRLFVRSLDSLDATAVAGTDGAKQPFWSPDGASIGFFALGKLMKVAVTGGVPVVICDAPDGKGGAWSPNGTIVFGPNMIFEGLVKVSANGGKVEPATLLDLDRGENSHRWPVFLPDGVHFLYFVRASVDERRGVYVARIDRPASTPGSPIFRSESEATFVPTSGRERGVLLSAADGQLQARPFDAATLKLLGDPRTLPVAVGANTPSHPVMLSASADLLATVATQTPYGVQLGAVARDGQGVRHVGSQTAELAPAVARWKADGPADSRYDARQSRCLGRGPPGRQPYPRHDRHRFGPFSRVVSGWAVGWHTDPAASPGGRLSIIAADATGAPLELPCPGASLFLRADRLVARRSPSHRQHALGYGCARTEMCGACRSRPAVRLRRFCPVRIPNTTRGYHRTVSGWPTFLRRTGRAEVFVRAMSGPPRRFVASNNGGSQPVWRRDGRELLLCRS